MIERKSERLVALVRSIPVSGGDSYNCFSKEASKGNGSLQEFAYDEKGEMVYGIDGLDLKPVSYGAKKSPIYTWEISDSSIADIRSNSYPDSKLEYRPSGSSGHLQWGH